MRGLRETGIVGSLSACKIFAGLPQTDLESIAQITTPRSLRKDQYLFHQGDPSEGFFVIQSGTINVHRVSAAGKEHVIHIFRAPASFAEASLAPGQVYPVDARALQASQVLLVRRSGFLEVIRRQPELSLRMLASMSAHLHDLVGQLEDLAAKNVETRLASWLLKRCVDPQAPDPCELELPMAKRMLAAELGTSSETLSRTLAQFKQRQLVQVRGRAITLLSPARLQLFLEESLSG